MGDDAKLVLVLSAGDFAEEGLTEVIGCCGCEALWLRKAGEWQTWPADLQPAVILADEDAPLLRAVVERYRRVPLILAAQGRRGPLPFVEPVFRRIAKPVKYAEVVFGVERALVYRSLALDCWDDGTFGVGELVGHSSVMREVYSDAAAAAGDGASTLVLGERGVGKTAVTRMIYGQWGDERTTLFVDCAAPASDQFDFRAAERSIVEHHTDRPWVGGTLVLGEVGTLSQSQQSELLAALQESRAPSLAGAAGARKDFRVISTSSDPLEVLAEDGRFLPDLLDALGARRITVPALRERREDVLYMARRLVKRLASDPFAFNARLTPDADELLAGYNWPGNARELRRVVARAAVFAEGAIGRSELALPPATNYRLCQAAAP